METALRISFARAIRFRTICSDTANRDLHNKTGTVNISGYKGNNPLFQHGPLRTSSDKRHFEHDDGTPFFWLGDTWWFGLCKRFGWPEDFRNSLTTIGSKKASRPFRSHRD